MGLAPLVLPGWCIHACMWAMVISFFTAQYLVRPGHVCSSPRFCIMYVCVCVCVRMCELITVTATVTDDYDLFIYSKFNKAPPPSLVSGLLRQPVQSPIYILPKASPTCSEVKVYISTAGNGWHSSGWGGEWMTLLRLRRGMDDTPPAEAGNGRHSSGWERRVCNQWL
jgi:hypothetical protein